jgi:hypothetical protein
MSSFLKFSSSLSLIQSEAVNIIQPNTIYQYRMQWLAYSDEYIQLEVVLFKS